MRNIILILEKRELKHRELSNLPKISYQLIESEFEPRLLISSSIYFYQERIQTRR